MKEKYCVIVWDSTIKGCTKKYFSSYGDVREYLDSLDGLNRIHSGATRFLWSVYNRDSKNKNWVYIGGFDHN